MMKFSAEERSNVSGNKKRAYPTLDEESRLISLGYRSIAGVDEVGRGALAGPVVAAAVILPMTDGFPRLNKVRDSKLLSPVMREKLYTLIMEEAISVGIGIITSEIIDSVNILNATKMAMGEAIKKLAFSPDYLLIDGSTLTRISALQKCIVGGDRLCFSIACASIMAKVTRDRIMNEYDNSFPSYGFARHKGYGTEYHLQCLRKFGPSKIHRCTFAPVRNLNALL
jgi:ribonuclease HII